MPGVDERQPGLSRRDERRHQRDEALVAERGEAAANAIGHRQRIVPVDRRGAECRFHDRREHRRVRAVPGDVVWLVMREVLVLVTAGMILGLAAAWGLGRLVGTQLYGVTPNDPLTIAAAAGILATVSLAAGYIPAIRATRVNPVRALRYE